MVRPWRKTDPQTIVANVSSHAREPREAQDHSPGALCYLYIITVCCTKYAVYLHGSHRDRTARSHRDTHRRETASHSGATCLYPHTYPFPQYSYPPSIRLRIQPSFKYPYPHTEENHVSGKYPSIHASAGLRSDLCKVSTPHRSVSRVADAKRPRVLVV